MLIPLFSSNYKLFFISSIVFIFINTIENFIHFTIGRNVDNKNKMLIPKIQIPTKYDLIKIIIVMIIFAFLQGFFTNYINYLFS